MIPNTTPAVAVFKHENEPRSTELIVAWDDDGGPLVAAERGTGMPRRLRPADDFSNFYGIDVDPPVEHYVAAVPGQGWTIQRTEPDGSVSSDPVIAFAIDERGYGTPITGAGDGIESEALDGDKVVLVRPGGWGNQ